MVLTLITGYYEGAYGKTITDMTGPEDKAREHIDQLLEAAGWDVQDKDKANLNGKLRGKTVTFFIHKIPHVSKTYKDFVSVETCRRSGVIRNRHWIVWVYRY